MIKRLISFALYQRTVTLALVAILAIAGLYAFREVPIEAFPDPDDVHVQVITLWPGQAAEEVEALVTRPAEQQLNGTPGLTGLRSVSMFGLSVITLTFEDGTEDNFARAQALEKMQGVSLPSGASWQLGALTTSTGEVFRYILRARNEKLEEVRAWQDWVIEPNLRQVPNVADVVAFGGGLKQYQVTVTPGLLIQHKVTLAQVAQALGNNNINVGGGVLRSGEQSLVVRGVGMFASIKDIESVVVATQDGRPVYVRDVASVATGMAPRQGIAAYFNADDPSGSVDDIVEGVVLNRKGSNALRVVEGVREKVAFLNEHVLPKSIRIEPIYDRTELVSKTVHTVLHNLIEGALLVVAILVVFTFSVRGALIVACVIPLSLLSAFIFLNIRGIPANLLSFGAVDFGMIVDAAVVVVEAMLVRKLTLAPDADFTHATEHTTSHLGRSILFAKVIIITALIPIFTFERVEGRIFRPMALTITAAIVGATVISLTLVPMLCAWLLKHARPLKPNFIVRGLTYAYERLLRLLLRHKLKTLALGAIALGGALYLGARLGTEFLPKLDEGNIWLTCTLPLSTSQDQAKQTERRIRSILESFPETRLLYSQLGRPDDGTDPKGQNNVEIAVYLPPRERWSTRDELGNIVDKEGLIERINAKLAQIPGVEFNFSQIIEDNVEEALSGVKGELAIKIFGDDLKVLTEQAEKVRAVLARVPGVADLAAERLSGQPNLNITIDREAIARFGLDAQTVLSVVESAVGGKVLGSILEKQRRFDLVLRCDEPSRESPERIGNIWVDTPSGQRIPLSQLCEIKVQDGAARISRDRNSRRIALKCGIRGRDMGGFVAEAQANVAKDVKHPPGYSMTWEGQFENQQRANARLRVIVPISILLVIGLLFGAFGRLRYALLIIACVPLALIGGLALLYLTDTRLSVAAAIGFIALSGVCVQNGLILVGQFNALRAQGMDIHTAVLEGSKARLRPVLMTALMAAIGMFPAATSHGIGSEVQRPLALVILGGMISAAILTLMLLPVLYEWFESTFPAPVTVPEGLID